MVNYPGTTTHCVYESIPFMIIQNPYKKYVVAGPARADTEKGEVYTDLSINRYSFPAENGTLTY